MCGLTYNLVGESVGFFKFDAMTALRLVAQVAACVASGQCDETLEEALRDLILDRTDEMGVADISGQPWMEIAFRKTCNAQKK